MKKAIPFGKYDLLERINVGGMAEVFRAKTYGVEGFEKLIAVKRILPNIAEDKEFTTMFVDEAKIAGQLSHANIAQIHDLGVVDGAYFIALEHIHGRDLRAIFDRCRQLGAPMPVAQACFVIMKLCEGLDYAHNKRDALGRDMNLVHRDVSPQNVIVSYEGEIKIIDFGIAKAAGKGAKTQAGILKGKFGYMSPEQVRGLPIDRRSDIFSTGIVLYELLTSERLFVGETDFSTLEKVRNVEILPPSTYNRKIPDELERIVLKALARDMDDRYSNAIDLHDELQAFVYTAGEFYSRKDLAAWMKKTFAREIEEDQAKIEGYRDFAPARVEVQTMEARPAPAARASSAMPARSPTRPPGSPTRPPGSATRPPGPASQHKVTQGIRKATISMPAAVPPPPVSPRAVNGHVRPSRELPAMPPAPPPMIVEQTDPDAQPSASTRPITDEPSKPRRGDLEWDDEELETQIYDSAVAPPVVAAKPVPSPRAERSSASASSSSPSGRSRRSSSASPAFVTAPTVPESDNLGTPSPVAARDTAVRVAETRRPERRPRHTGSGFDNAFPPPREPSLTARGTIIPEIHVRRPPSPAKMWLVAALGAVVLAGLVVGGHWVLSGDSSSAVAGAPTSGAGAPKPTDPAPAPTLPVDPGSGFDITTEPPAGKVRLDGNEIGNAPLRVRSLLAGKHTLEVGGLAGYQSAKQEIVVEQGKAAAISIKLTKEGEAPPAPATVTPQAPTAPPPASLIVKLTSEPAGAKVTLVVNGERTVLGVTPTEAKVDPQRRSEVTFELDGHAPVTKAISGSDTTIAAVLVPGSAPTPPPTAPPVETVAPPKEIAAPVAAKPREPVRRDPPPPRKPPPPRETVVREPRPAPRETTPRETTPRETTPRDPGPRTVEVASGNGKLTLGSKPPCKVLVDGKDTGRTTPVRELDVPAGSASVTLVNDEFGIRETFSVNVKQGETTRVIKDFSDRLPQ